MPRPIALLHHLDPPEAGHAGEALRAAGAIVMERDLLAGEPLPGLDELSAIVSLGGEQSATEIERYPYLVEEAELLRRAVSAEVPVLGICLGGQLLARALGARVSRMPRRTIGWWSLDPLAAAAGDPLLGALGAPVPALHWNEDAFDVPPGAVELLPRAGPGGEAFRAGESAWGLQYHPEVTAAILDHWYGLRMAEQAGVSEAAAREADARHLPDQRRAATELFGAFAGVVERAATRAREAPGVR